MRRSSLTVTPRPKRLLGRQVGRLVGGLVGRLVGGQVGRLVGRLVGRRTGCLGECSIDCSIACSIECSIECSIRCVLVCVLVCVVGCQDVLGLEAPELAQLDASSPTAGDVPESPTGSPSDAAPGCAAAPAGCTAFACAATNSCYYACSGRASWIGAQSYCSQIAGWQSGGSLTGGSLTGGSLTGGSLTGDSQTGGSLTGDSLTSDSQSAGGCLATISGELEQQCVVAATQPTSSDPVWMGLYQLDAAHEPADGWLWTCGAGDWRGWASFEPYDLVGDRDCAELGASGGWKADVCGYSRRFVCKVEMQ